MDPAEIHQGFKELIQRSEARGHLSFWTHACLRQMTSMWHPNSRWLRTTPEVEQEGAQLLDSLESGHRNIKQLSSVEIGTLLRTLPKRILLDRLPEYLGLQLCADAHDRRRVLRIEHKLLTDLNECRLEIDDLDIEDTDTLLSLVPEAQSDGRLDQVALARQMMQRREAKRQLLSGMESGSVVEQAVLFAERAMAASPIEDPVHALLGELRSHRSRLSPKADNRRHGTSRRDTAATHSALRKLYSIEPECFESFSKFAMTIVAANRDHTLSFAEQSALPSPWYELASAAQAVARLRERRAGLQAEALLLRREADDYESNHTSLWHRIRQELPSLTDSKAARRRQEAVAKEREADEAQLEALQLEREHSFKLP